MEKERKNINNTGKERYEENGVEAKRRKNEENNERKARTKKRQKDLRFVWIEHTTFRFMSEVDFSLTLSQLS